MVKDSKQSMAMLWTTWLSGEALNGKIQRTVGGNVLDYRTTRTSPKWLETESSQ